MTLLLVDSRPEVARSCPLILTNLHPDPAPGTVEIDGSLASSTAEIGRGLYVAEGSRVTEHHTLVQAAKRVPHGIICLLSALRFHGLTTQAPHEVWMAIAHTARRTRADYPPMRSVHFSGGALSYGIAEKKLEGITVRVFDPAKTVADCFKYRNKIGLEVALEALRDCYRERKATMDELFMAAKVCRVARVMQPYMESLA